MRMRGRTVWAKSGIALSMAFVAMGSLATSVHAEDDVHCSIHANPSVVDGNAETGIGDATTLIWWSSDNVVSAEVDGVGGHEGRGWWWRNDVDESREYKMTVTTADGRTADCYADVTFIEEAVQSEGQSHGFCEDVYPGRDIADIDNNGWGDTQDGEAGCRINPANVATEEAEEENIFADAVKVKISTRDGWLIQMQKVALLLFQQAS